MNNDHAIEQEIQAKGKTAPRVTPDSIKAVIVSEHYFTAAEGATGADVAKVAIAANGKIENHIFDDCQETALHLLTFCVLVLKNGFTVTGKSACASPENFDADIGRKVAFGDAMQQIWPLEGYLLKQRLFESSQVAASQEIATRCGMPASGRPAYQQRVVDEHDELTGKIVKLAQFLPTPTFARLSDDEQGRLGHQLDTMRDYAVILASRIAAFPVG